MKNVFEEIVFNVPEKSDQQSLRLIVDYLLGLVDFVKND